MTGSPAGDVLEASIDAVSWAFSPFRIVRPFALGDWVAFAIETGDVLPAHTSEGLRHGLFASFAFY